MTPEQMGITQEQLNRVLELAKTQYQDYQILLTEPMSNNFGNPVSAQIRGEVLESFIEERGPRVLSTLIAIMAQATLKPKVPGSN